MFRRALSILSFLIVAGSSPPGVRGAEWFVDPQVGDDKNTGARKAPFATAQKAVNAAKPGDTIQLLPKGALYRQSILLRGKSDLVIEGNGVTLDGSDPLPEDGWEAAGNGLRRLRLPQTMWNRHLLAFAGRVERMGRTQSSNSAEFPEPQDLKEGQFCFVNDPDPEAPDAKGTGSRRAKFGWLHVSGDVRDLEWTVRPNGLATAGTNSNIVVRNLNARRFLNDGFNIHGHSTGLKFENVTGYDCFDEGFSAHDTCEAEIRKGGFWGNENAIADVNDCVTHYRDCEFRDSVSADVLLIGRTHSLTDCRIINTTPATALSAGPRGDNAAVFELSLTRVIVEGKRPEKARFRVNGGVLKMTDCALRHVDFNPSGARLLQNGTRRQSKTR
jgi:hypothetical protein